MSGNQAMLRDIGDALKKFMPTGIGFFLCIFQFGDTTGRANYISTGQRQDMVKMLRETADRLEKRQDEGSPW